MPHALMIDDDATSLEALRRVVEREGFTVLTALDLESARALVDRNLPDLVLLDLRLPDGNGLELVRQIRGRDSGVDIVVVTGFASVDTAIAALQQGATDYLTKPIDVAKLLEVLKSVMVRIERNRRVVALRDELRRHRRFGVLVGDSPAMTRIYALLERVAPTATTVLVIGETGTGKDLVATSIHEMSGRHGGPLLAVNCGAMPANLIESELFGHEQGSFTGADRAHRGVFERAHGGTLFLDEITEMAPDLQVKLLRVLESGSFARVGGDRPIVSDVRIVAATNRDPAEAVSDGSLREDLLYRLNVFPIELPPLRDRDGDIDALARHFLEELNRAGETTKRFTDEAIEKLHLHDWPGNVRELRNVVDRAYVLGEGAIGPESVAFTERTRATKRKVQAVVQVGTSIAEAERELILRTLEELGGDKREAASVLGISLKTLYNRLAEYGLSESPRRGTSIS